MGTEAGRTAVTTQCESAAVFAQRASTAAESTASAVASRSEAATAAAAEATVYITLAAAVVLRTVGLRVTGIATVEARAGRRRGSTTAAITTESEATAASSDGGAANKRIGAAADHRRHGAATACIDQRVTEAHFDNRWRLGELRRRLDGGGGFDDAADVGRIRVLVDDIAVVADATTS